MVKKYDRRRQEDTHAHIAHNIFCFWTRRNFVDISNSLLQKKGTGGQVYNFAFMLYEVKRTSLS